MIQLDTKVLEQKLDKLTNELPLVLEEAMKQFAEEMALMARTTTYYIPRGGNGLREATQAFTVSQFVTGVQANKPYANVVDKGRGPVYPITAKALRFKIGGQVFFRKSVGPAEPRPFFSSMVSWAKRDMDRFLSEHINTYLSRL